MKQVFPVLIIIMLCLGLFAFVIRIQPARAAATIVVPDDYSTIQVAINAANHGDIIFVRNGIYPEQIEVNRSVTLIGESNQNTIIEAYKSAKYNFGVHISASNTAVENFRIVPANSTDRLGTPTLVAIDGRSTSCSNDTVRNCVFVFPTDVGAGMDAIDVLGSVNNTVTGNLITIADETDAGMALLYSSHYNTIENNTITGGWVSIYSDFSNYNVFSNNYLADQTSTNAPVGGVGALTLLWTEGDIVRGNTFINNSIGFSTDEADTSVYHNNFVNNTQQVLIEGISVVTFDNGYPFGGNYWSDYTGVDSHSGPYQNVTGSDGIGDTPYAVDANNLDNYPLMSPWMPSNLVGDLNGDGKVSLQDLQLLAQAYDSKPSDPNWNPLADIAPPYGIISLTDLVTLAVHYGQHYA